MDFASPLALVQEQLEAYNARDLERLLATYAADAEQFQLHGERLAQGHAELRARFQMRFTEPDLHAQLISRTVLGAMVVDSELITRNLPEGLAQVEMLCIYEVQNGQIRKASFHTGATRLLKPAR